MPSKSGSAKKERIEEVVGAFRARALVNPEI